MSVAISADITKIRQNPANPRKKIRNVDELAMSIKEHGLVQPIVLTPDPDRPDGHYLLHAGHRRLAAFRKLGIKQIPAVLRRIPDSRSIEVMLVENLQRDDLTPVEVGQALVELQASHDPPLTQADMARRLGKSTGWVHMMLMFAELDEEDAEAFHDNELTWADALDKAREHKRARGGRVHAPAARVDDRASRGWYLAFSHPLARDAQLVCDWHGHSRKSGRRIGNVACGACWEATIRGDERAGAAGVDAVLAAVDPDLDEMVVDGIVDPHTGTVAGNPAERLEAARRMLDIGVADVDVLRRLGVSTGAQQKEGHRLLAAVARINRARAAHHRDAVAS